MALGGAVLLGISQVLIRHNNLIGNLYEERKKDDNV